MCGAQCLVKSRQALGGAEQTQYQADNEVDQAAQHTINNRANNIHVRFSCCVLRASRRHHDCGSTHPFVFSRRTVHYSTRSLNPTGGLGRWFRRVRALRHVSTAPSLASLQRPAGRPAQGSSSSTQVTCQRYQPNIASLHRRFNLTLLTLKSLYLSREYFKKCILYCTPLILATLREQVQHRPCGPFPFLCLPSIV